MEALVPCLYMGLMWDVYAMDRQTQDRKKLNKRLDAVETVFDQQLFMESPVKRLGYKTHVA